MSTSGYAGDCYHVWVESGSTSTAMITEWDAWNGGMPTAGTATSSTAWVEWTDQQGEALYRGLCRSSAGNAAWRAAGNATWRAREEALEAECRQRLEADKKADNLLAEHLDDGQRDAYKRCGEFYVVGSDGVRYGVKPAQRSNNVQEYSADGRRVARYCAHLPHDIPAADNALAQKLAIETDVEAFKRVANRSAC